MTITAKGILLSTWITAAGLTMIIYSDEERRVQAAGKCLLTRRNKEFQGEQK